MSCSKCVDDVCQCSRVEAVNRFSKDYKAGELAGRKGEAGISVTTRCKQS